MPCAHRTALGAPRNSLCWRVLLGAGSDGHRFCWARVLGPACARTGSISGFLISSKMLPYEPASFKNLMLHTRCLNELVASCVRNSLRSINRQLQTQEGLEAGAGAAHPSKRHIPPQQTAKGTSHPSKRQHQLLGSGPFPLQIQSRHGKFMSSHVLLLALLLSRGGPRHSPDVSPEMYFFLNESLGKRALVDKEWGGTTRAAAGTGRGLC